MRCPRSGGATARARRRWKASAGTARSTAPGAATRARRPPRRCYVTCGASTTSPTGGCAGASSPTARAGGYIGRVRGRCRRSSWRSTSCACSARTRTCSPPTVIASTGCACSRRCSGARGSPCRARTTRPSTPAHSASQPFTNSASPPTCRGWCSTKCSPPSPPRSTPPSAPRRCRRCARRRWCCSTACCSCSMPRTASCCRSATGAITTTRCAR